MDSSHEAMKDILRRKVDDARRQHDQAQTAFWNVAAENDGDRADHDRRTREADRAYIEAQERLILELKRFTDFLLLGLAPTRPKNEPK